LDARTFDIYPFLFCTQEFTSLWEYYNHTRSVFSPFPWHWIPSKSQVRSGRERPSSLFDSCRSQFSNSASLIVKRHKIHSVPFSAWSSDMILISTWLCTTAKCSNILRQSIRAKVWAYIHVLTDWMKYPFLDVDSMIFPYYVYPHHEFQI